MQSVDSKKIESLRQKIEFLYPDHDASLIVKELVSVLGIHTSPNYSGKKSKGLWDQATSVLITYADNLNQNGKRPLQTLKEFCDKELAGAFSHIHLLPFYPWTSDDGFSVQDYSGVGAEFGTWDDVSKLSERFALMFDLVLNHCSAKHQWFQDYLAGKEYALNYFIEADPKIDYSQVTRPRSLPLLTEFATSRGPRHIWTTFSADQVDLNFKEPGVLIELVRVLMLYLNRGAKIIRFDAPTYLWKELGTTCVSLPQTHSVMQVFRQIAEMSAPDLIVLSETNVPHSENVSYFGNGNEAHMVYNFALPPLLLHGFVTETSQYLNDWVASLGSVPAGCTFLNFTASHDGIGVRGIKGITPDEDLDRLVGWVNERGGRISTRRVSDGSDIPYELNITYFDALGSTKDETSELQVRRFIGSQLTAMALRGIPAIYFQSLIAGQNDYEGLKNSGRARSINRRKWSDKSLAEHLDLSFSSRIFSEIKTALRARKEIPALHPEAEQHTLNLGSAVFAIERRAADSHFLHVLNLSSQKTEKISLPEGNWKNPLVGKMVSGSMDLLPGEAAWLVEGA